MKIDHIDVINLRHEYPAERRFAYAGGTCTGRLSSLILVHTDTGQVGIGSAYSHPGLVALIVKQQLEPLLRGRDPREVEFLWDRMYALTRWYGRKGAAMSALGGLDVAFWDLRGKALGKPVWAILGGDTASCPAYASALLWKPEVKLLADEAAGHLANGFRRMKMRLGRSEEYDVAAVRAVRGAIGKDNDLMADASMKYHVTLAQRIGKFLAEQNAFWFEEPFLPEDIDSYAALRGTVAVRIAAGENEFGVQGFTELIRAGAVDIVQPDASRCGGISEVWIDTGKPGNQPTAEQSESHLTILRNRGVLVSLFEGLLDRCFDRAFDALQRIGVARAGQHLPALCGILLGEVEAEAARGAGDQDGRHTVTPQLSSPAASSSAASTTVAICTVWANRNASS